MEETCIQVKTDTDIIAARQKGRELAETLGFSLSNQTMIATAISELTRNIVTYAKGGEIVFRLAERNGAKGIIVIARDQGPGIQDLRLAMQEGYSTSRSLGMGLPGVRRLMDEFDIVSELGKGTTVTVKKWITPNHLF